MPQRGAEERLDRPLIHGTVVGVICETSCFWLWIVLIGRQDGSQRDCWAATLLLASDLRDSLPAPDPAPLHSWIAVRETRDPPPSASSAVPGSPCQRGARRCAWRRPCELPPMPASCRRGTRRSVRLRGLRGDGRSSPSSSIPPRGRGAF